MHAEEGKKKIVLLLYPFFFLLVLSIPAGYCTGTSYYYSSSQYGTGTTVQQYVERVVLSRGAFFLTCVQCPNRIARIIVASLSHQLSTIKSRCPQDLIIVFGLFQANQGAIYSQVSQHHSVVPVAASTNVAVFSISKYIAIQCLTTPIKK